jgi:hypothetical protein
MLARQRSETPTTEKQYAKQPKGLHGIRAHAAPDPKCSIAAAVLLA